MRRAVITGVGPVTPIGIGKEDFWAGLRHGRSAVERLTTFDPSALRSQMAAEVRAYHPQDYFSDKELKRLDRFSQFALVAARLAVADAGLDLPTEDRQRVGITLGSALGGLSFAEKQVSAFHERGLHGVEPSLAFSVFCGAGSCQIAIAHGITGPAWANSNSCASGTIALGEALQWIRRGEADLVLAGGSEAPLAPLCYGAFALIRAMSSCNDDPAHACRPFDAQRDGFVMAEGAAMLVVEELEHAQTRGAHIYGELVGYGLTNDAFHMTAPHPTGEQAARCMRLALDDAALRPEEIDYVNAHGSATPLNDKTETMALKSVFGAHAARMAISGTKGHHGHALGATGAFEAVACALALEEQYVPPTLSLDTPDPECDLDYTPNQGRTRALDVILSNSFGFGGINACLVMRRLAA
ncbi:MAG TPA: beta-ketoacyl-ACP synthase II [Armatimonadota bacterium]|jgi:3-oxoacyl-[acyl-carrier-protein] synthase II